MTRNEELVLEAFERMVQARKDRTTLPGVTYAYKLAGWGDPPKGHHNGTWFSAADAREIVSQLTGLSEKTASQIIRKLAAGRTDLVSKGQSTSTMYTTATERDRLNEARAEYGRELDEVADRLEAHGVNVERKRIGDDTIRLTVTTSPIELAELLDSLVDR